jgi:hypothetical protein
MNAARALLAATVTVVMVLSALGSLSVAGPSSTSPMQIGSATTTHASAPTVGAHAAPSVMAHAASPAARAPAAATAAPASTPCSPHWSGIYFQRDACVSFSVPGEIVPPSINYVPFNSTVSQYATGFWMNVSTDVPIAAAELNIWATSWPGGTQGAAVSGFDPSEVVVSGTSGEDQHAMQINANNETASYFFNIIKYFFPGTTVSFNLELETTASVSPNIIYSNQTINVTQSYPSGYIDYPSWEVDIGSPWSSSYFQSDIAVSTDPNVLSTPAYDPNPGQTPTVTITSVSATGGRVTPIPDAIIEYSIFQSSKGGGTTNSSYSGDFSPENATVESYTFPEPFPGSKIYFNITGRLPWQGDSGYIDLIVSQEYNFTWSTKGGWWYPTSPLEQNLNLTTSPNVLTTVAPHLPTGTRVNVTIHEPIQNVTISSSYVNFQFDDHGAVYKGSLTMIPMNPNTTFIELPGLPPNSSLSFTVSAKDYYNDPIFSGSYSYMENGSLASPPASGMGLFFIEVYDVGAQSLVASANYTVQNTSWTQNGTTGPMGFGKLLSPGASSYIFLSESTYIITVTVFGETIVRTVTVTDSTPFTVVFYVSSTLVTPQTSSPPPPTFAIGGVIGLVAGAVASYPILIWYKERRAKAEAEQRRVTL